MAPHLSRGNAEAYARPAYSRDHGDDEHVVLNEAAFHHFFGIELRRADKSRQTTALILISARLNTGWQPIPASIARAVFSVLRESVREVDLIGWYRADRVVAATLVHPVSLSHDAKARIKERVTRSLRRHLVDAERLRVRVVAIHARGNS